LLVSSVPFFQHSLVERPTKLCHEIRLCACEIKSHRFAEEGIASERFDRSFRDFGVFHHYIGLAPDSNVFLGVHLVDLAVGAE